MKKDAIDLNETIHKQWDREVTQAQETWKAEEEKVQKEWWRDEAREIISTFKNTIVDLDEHEEVEQLLTSGMIILDEKGSPAFNAKGEALIQLMRKASEAIVHSSSSNTEMAEKAKVLLPYVEGIAINSILNLTATQTQQLHKIQRTIIERSILQFDEMEKSQAIINASEPANAEASNILAILHPELSDEQILLRLKKLKLANAYDVHRAMLIVFKIPDSDQKIDIPKLIHEAYVPQNIERLVDNKILKLQAVVESSTHATLTDDEILDLIVLLESVHMAWAASQFPRQKSGEERFSRSAYLQFPAIKVEFAKTSWELAILEVLKDVVYM